MKTYLKAFGFERMLYSSNWPVCTTFSKPKYWKEILDNIFRIKRNIDSSVDKNSNLLY